jgi:hypothetical protein
MKLTLIVVGAGGLKNYALTSEKQPAKRGFGFWLLV